MKTLIVLLALILNVAAVAQKSSSTPFSFAKKTLLFSPPDTTVFGKGRYAYNTSYFMDNTLRLNNRSFLRCGAYYKKFEAYCQDKGMAYDPLLLKEMRKKLVPANIIYFSSFPTAVIPFVRAFNTNFTNLGKAVFLENYNYLFWALVVGEIVVGVEIKAKAERRFNAAMKKRVSY